MNSNFATLKNPIFRLYWAGWESDTLKLQSNGWQISTQQDVYRNSIRFAVHHPKFQISGMTDPVDFYFRGMNQHEMFSMNFPPVTLRWMASHFEVRMHVTNTEMMNWDAIDATPAIIDQQVKTLEDFKIFRPLNPINEIIIPQADVSMLLDDILKKQDPKQKEIRDRMRKDSMRFNRMIEGMDLNEIGKLVQPTSDIVAQIVAVA